MNAVEIRKLSRALIQDKRGEAAIYGMVFTFASVVLVGLAMLASGLGNSFHSVGALLGSVSAGL